MIFKEGDIVRCVGFGDKTFVLEKSGLSDYPLKIMIDGFRRTFTSDGKLFRDDDDIDLTLIERPVKIVEKWVNMFFNNWDKMAYSGLGVFDNKEEAEANATEPFDKEVRCFVRYIGAAKIYIEER